MQLVCPQCHQQLEFSGPRPRFCSFCGEMLADSQPVATVASEPEAATPPPKQEADAETLPPTPPAPCPGEVPETVGPYRLGRRLGGGGMGTVYEATDMSSGRRVALKLLQPEYAASKETIDRFRQEGELASKLVHPRCVFVLAVDEAQGRPYIVMELMTGSTLESLVKENGPLPPERALRKILDVIDGLHEVHQLGLVHRDVKPSNCFLEGDGRVKVGDFGLAKSLLRQAHLTRTGTFLGTPLFTAPEQIKMEKVDAQSDLYSVAATLYFLLTGQAPFQTGDPMATMARIVADDPPSMRRLRPELSKALDKVVLRGLERDRKRRWRSLDELRRALLPFLPAEPSVGGLGLRFVAHFLDLFLLSLAVDLGFYALGPTTVTLMVMATLARATLDLAYFGVLEGLWGRSLGKRLLRLRVGTPAANRPPGVGRALLRAAILYVLLKLGIVVHQFLFVGGTRDPALLGFVLVFWFCLAIGLLVSTMRKRNGYRGLHELLSGTRTYRLRWPEIRQRCLLEAHGFHPELEHSAEFPAQIGPYRIRGVLRKTPQDQTLLGDDVHLGRAVWVWVRPETEPALDEARRTVNRTTRSRWVSCGTLAGRQWDAFLAPSGCPLPALVTEGRRLTWAEFRGILEDLTDELQASCAEGTLPQALTERQVWVSPDGHAQLVETPFVSAATAATPQHTLPANDQQRALAFLGHVAVVALEGRARPAESPPARIQAPLPLYAASLLNRLFPDPPGSPAVVGDKVQSTQKRAAEPEPPYDRIEQFKADLLASQSEPAEITRWIRAKHLLGHGLFACLGFMAMFLLFGFLLMLAFRLSGQRSLGIGEHEEMAMTLGALAVALILFFLPAYLARGGLSFIRAGIAVVGVDGRQASRLRCLWRAILVWVFVGVFGALTGIGIAITAEFRWLQFGIAGVAVALFAGYVVLILRNPARAPHDYLARTYLVPR
jgi:hypothetical protein